MLIERLIHAKRLGNEFTRAEIQTLIDATVDGSLKGPQLGALLMAMCTRGLTFEETVHLTDAMARSGGTLDLSDITPRPVDKHSTGGVGDKTTLVVAPIVAACGIPVAKMSGHALGFTGGTLDKLAVIPGLRTRFTPRQFKRQLLRTGLVIAGQSKTLAPADGIWYAARHVTATVDFIPLIASSVLSKKIAAGAQGIVIDVKVGSGAFAKTIDQGRELADVLVRVGSRLGRDVKTVISSMEQPLGNAIGDALEVKEAVGSLRGEGPADLRELATALAIRLMLASGAFTNEAAAGKAVLDAIRTGAAYAKLLEFVRAQGGDTSVIENLDALPQAAIVEPVAAPAAGIVQAMDTEAIGWAVAALKTDATDHSHSAAGVEMKIKIGEQVAKGEPMAVVHALGARGLEEARASLLKAIVLGAGTVEPPPLILDA